MKKKKMVYSIIILIFVTQGIIVMNNNITIENTNINALKTQNVASLEKVYTYNISQFDSHLIWVDLDWSAPIKGTAYTNSGGQIKITLKQIGEKDPNDYSIFSGPLPYIDLSFFENQSNSLIQNFTLTNIPNSEAAMNLALGYNSFLSGFLIPVNNLSQLKSQATEQVSSSGYMPGTLNIEETYCSIKFDFRANDLSQNSTMLYDKWLGLLVWGKVENVYGPDLEISLINGSFDYNLHSIYDLTQFDSYFSWVDLDWTVPVKGIAYTNSGGQIKINITNIEEKVPNDYSVFSGPLPYIDISFLENQSNTLIQNLTLTNIPNSEAAMNLALSYNSFLSGFLIPVNNISQLKSQAIEQVSSSGYMPGTLNIEETYCSIKFDFRANDLSQNSTMLYNKWLGLLVWAKVENVYGPDLEINLKEISIRLIKDDVIPGYEVTTLISIFLIGITCIASYQYRKKKFILKSFNN